jgi:hypothetical protein
LAEQHELARGEPLDAVAHHAPAAAALDQRDLEFRVKVEAAIESAAALIDDRERAAGRRDDFLEDDFHTNYAAPKAIWRKL